MGVGLVDDLVFRDEAGDLLAGLQQLFLGMGLVGPESLQVAHEGVGDNQRRLDLEEGGTREGFHPQRQEDPSEQDDAQRDERAGLVDKKGVNLHIQ